jgi:hypothetical protein
MTNEAKTITAKFSGKCTACLNIIPSGTQCIWTRGAGVRHVACPVVVDSGAAVVPIAQQDSKSVAVTMGVFKKDGRIYVVKPNKDRTRVYAKEIVESPARMTESGAVVDFETVYAPGVVFKLTEADRWDLADAKDFLTKFSRCIVCGRHLKAAKSVESSIGPVCAKYFGSKKTCSHEHAPAAMIDSIAKSPKTIGEIADAMIEDEGQRNEADDMLTSDAINNAKLNMTDEQLTLLAEIKRMNAESRRWMAGGIDRWAGILTEDIAYWAKSGITSVADFDAMQAAEDAKERRKAGYDY